MIGRFNQKYTSLFDDRAFWWLGSCDVVDRSRMIRHTRSPSFKKRNKSNINLILAWCSERNGPSIQVRLPMIDQGSVIVWSFLLVRVDEGVPVPVDDRGSLLAVVVQLEYRLPRTDVVLFAHLQCKYAKDVEAVSRNTDFESKYATIT